MDVLAKAGLLTAEAGSDRRQPVLRLSQAGAAKVGAARQHWHAAQQAVEMDAIVR